MVREDFGEIWKSNEGDFHGGRGFVGFACGSPLVIRPVRLQKALCLAILHVGCLLRKR